MVKQCSCVGAEEKNSELALTDVVSIHESEVKRLESFGDVLLDLDEVVERRLTHR